MGRGGGKVTMKQIQNEKVRKSAFIQRKKGLIKKVSDFSKNFGVEVCLIAYDGDGDGKSITWPQNFSILQSMLTKYEQQKIETTPKYFGVKDYFANKKNMVEVDILNVRKKIAMKKYPTWSRSFNNMEMEQLRDFVDTVDLKIQTCNQRISMLKDMQQSNQTSFMQNIDQIKSVAPKTVASTQSSEPDDLIDISEMIDFNYLKEWDEILTQKNVPTPLKPVDNINEFENLDNIVDKSDMDWADQLVDFNDWTVNTLNGGNGWVKQPYVFECQDFCFLSKLFEQQFATLDAFSQPRYEF